MKPIHVRPEADADLDGLTEYYAAIAGSEFPDSGSLVTPATARFAGCRYVLLHGFQRILIFYRNQEFHLDIIRVVHGSRDLEEALRT